MSIDVEEWFDSNWFSVEEIYPNYNDVMFDIEFTINKFLSIFEKYSIESTFFILINVLNKYPVLIDNLRDTNHEIALHGIDHRGITDLGINAFKKQIFNGKKILESLFKTKILGYRAPNMDISMNVFEILSQMSLKYDSSIMPSYKIPRWYGWPRSPLHPFNPLINITEFTDFIEFPLAVFPYLRIPGGGGWYLRNFGLNWVKLTLKTLLKKHSYAVFYIHPWEVSCNNPHHPDIPFHVFRRTGEWSLKALESIIKTFKRYASLCTFREYLNENI